MSDTPITDKKAIDITGGLYGVTHLRRNPKGNFVRVNFARQLERENAALRSLVQHWYKLVPENIRSSIEDAQKEAKP